MHDGRNVGRVGVPITDKAAASSTLVNRRTERPSRSGLIAKLWYRLYLDEHRFRWARPNNPVCVTYQRSSSSSKSPAATERLCLVVSSLRAWSAIGEMWFHSLRASCRFLSNFVPLGMAGSRSPFHPHTHNITHIKTM